MITVVKMMNTIYQMIPEQKKPIYYAEEAGAVQIEVPDVEIIGETPAMFNDQDSVSTFKTSGQSISKKISSQNKPAKAKNSVTFIDTSDAAPNLQGKDPAPQTSPPTHLTGTMEDGSI
jgi:hypothetical protein